MRKKLSSLIFLFLAGFAHAQGYDFSAVAPSGQTLYYEILTSSTVGVTYPNDSAFSDVYGLSPWRGYTKPTGSLTIPSSVSYGGTIYTVTEIDSFAFYECRGLTSVTIPNPITTIEDYALSGLDSLYTVNFNADSCTYMDYALYAGNLTTVNIGQNVKMIPAHAFYACSGLTSITIPRNVKSIGDNAFSYCSNLTTVNFNADSCTNMGYHSDSNWVFYVFGNCNVSTVNIGSNVKMIPNGGFSGCTNLQSITFPDSLESIGNLSFRGCTGLTSVTIPRNVRNIGASAFWACSNLTTVNFNPDSCTYLGYSSDWTYYLFGSSVTTINIGNNVKMIPNGVFSNCTNLQSITFPDSLESIGNSSFMNCTSPTSVTIPRNVKSVGYYAFYGCSNLTTVNLNADSCANMGYRNETMTSYAPFKNCNVSTVNIGSNVKMIPAAAFCACTNLQSVTIPNSVKSIGSDAFYGCTGLTSVVIPDSVERIGNESFGSCTSLTSITIPRRVRSIGRWAFKNCSNLSTVNYNADSCTHMGWYDTNSYAIYPPFQGCGGLNAIYFGNNVKVIPDYTFLNRRIRNLIIPDSVEYIGSGAFGYCDSLESLVIGNAVDSIGVGAFHDCSGLTSITSKRAIAPKTGLNAFTGILDSIPVYIPCGSTASYSARWSYFTNFVGEMFATVSVSSADTVMGTASVVTQPTCDSATAVIAATPNAGYAFAYWNDGNTQNPRSLTINRDTMLVAYFTLSPDTIVLHDTTILHDTILIHDTTFVHDTTVVNNYIHDTTIVHDTAYVQVYVHDTTVVRDTVVVNNYIHDTVYINNYIHDTTIVNNYIHDTAYVHDTTIVNNYIYDTVYINNYIHDTTIVNNYIHDTAYVHDTTIVNNYIHDTTYIDNYIYDTVMVPMPIDYYTLTLASEQPTLGFVVGSGTYSDSTTVEIAAVAIIGNHFVQWSDGSTENPRHVLVREDMSLYASFAADEVGITDVQMSGATITVQGNIITVQGAAGERVRIFDVVGRLLSTEMSVAETQSFRMMSTGVYLVQVGDGTAQRVVVR